MRRIFLLLLAAGGVGACGVYTGPSGPKNVYALVRVGTQHLPVPVDGGSPLPLLVADTFRLTSDRSKSDSPILQQTTVIRQTVNGKLVRSDVTFVYSIGQGTLTFDTCPVGSFCLASLVYAPRVFRIAGDSLFEVIQPGLQTPPHVYGLVRY